MEIEQAPTEHRPEKELDAYMRVRTASVVDSSADISWGRPLAKKCPECGSSYLIEKFLKTGAVARCPNAECKFKRPIEVPPEASVA
jgi:uncharacterized protein (DUF983 family)